MIIEFDIVCSKCGKPLNAFPFDKNVIKVDPCEECPREVSKIRKCEICSREFIPHNGRQKFCCKNCSLMGRAKVYKRYYNKKKKLP